MSATERALAEVQPMKDDELGKFVCVIKPAAGCLQSPHITISAGGLWVKSQTPDVLDPTRTRRLWSSGHAACVAAWAHENGLDVTVKRDGKPLAYVADGNAAFAWLHRHQGMSVDWAIRYEGYAVHGPDGSDLWAGDRS